ncbi:hypothetical protein [Acidovorax sp. SUPP2825]|uniref:hypothetical protein n=1 Tax=Acidovorax sp. SUPP2825 TaxID=2920879 RepID=UPI0023DE62F8|nr:hypothetical protein [Acidovorax sp. SUPP2825]GKS95587.1 hypothetical protein AVAK2825_13650 [Acidovorax sp. SUPP2825]
MGYLFENIVSVIYRQMRAGQSPPVRLVLNPVQMRQLLAEHAAAGNWAFPCGRSTGFWEWPLTSTRRRPDSW